MKTRLGLVALLIVAVSSFSLILATSNWSIVSDPSNAVQHISEVIFLKDSSSNAESGVVLTNSGNYVKINTRRNGENKNIIIRGDEENTIVDSIGSHVLGGKYNMINGSSYGTIIGGFGNQIGNGNYSTIGGGKNNIILGDYNVIAGGSGNAIIEGEYSSIPGGENNGIRGSYSVALGVNSEVNGDYSVALGSGSKVYADRSFLWTDGNQGDNKLEADDVFAVVSEKGMVINADKPHSFAKLTVSGSLIIRSDDTDLECMGDTKGVIAEKSDGCLCSCDGSGWNALYRGCDDSCSIGKKEPECGSIRKICDTGGNFYSGGCIDGKVIEGTGSYFVDIDNNVYRTCQSDDGNTKQCSGSVSDDCGEVGEYVCDTSKIDTTNAHQVRYSSNTDIEVGWIFENEADLVGIEYCAWLCDDGYTPKLGEDGILRCVEKGCVAGTNYGYHFGDAQNGSWKQSSYPRTFDYGSGTKQCWGYALCDKGIFTGFVETGCVYKCNPGVAIDNNYDNYGLTKLYYPVSPIVESGAIVPVSTGVSTSFGELYCSGHAVCDLGNHLAFTGESSCSIESCNCPARTIGDYEIEVMNCGTQEIVRVTMRCDEGGGDGREISCSRVATCSDGEVTLGMEHCEICNGIIQPVLSHCNGNISEEDNTKILKTSANYVGNWQYVQRSDFSSGLICKWTCNEDLGLSYNAELGTCECADLHHWDPMLPGCKEEGPLCSQTTTGKCEGGVEGEQLESYSDYSTWECSGEPCCLCNDGRACDREAPNMGCNSEPPVPPVCHHCAKNGFPYCFPIVFGASCNESSFT